MKTGTVNATLTAAAEKFIRRVLRFGAGPEAGLKLKVTPGGCSGLAVEFDVAHAPSLSEVVWEPAGLRIFVDRGSLLFLNGATVDFSESVSQTGLMVTAAGATGRSSSQSSAFVPVTMLVRG